MKKLVFFNFMVEYHRLNSEKCAEAIRKNIKHIAKAIYDKDEYQTICKERVYSFS